MFTDTLINYGGAIKAVEESDTGWKFGGYLVVFDSPDISKLKDRFTKSTDFDIADGDRRSVYYNHGLDGTIKRVRLGECRVSIKDAGVWIEGEIKKRTDYLAKHAEQIAQNIKQFGLSSGAPAHLVERKSTGDGHEVLLWPIAEASITPTPAEPLTGCVSLKSLVGTDDCDDLELKWDESAHPRDNDGKFSSGGGGGAGRSGASVADKVASVWQGAKVKFTLNMPGTPYHGVTAEGTVLKNQSNAFSRGKPTSLAMNITRSDGSKYRRVFSVDQLGQFEIVSKNTSNKPSVFDTSSRGEWGGKSDDPFDDLPQLSVEPEPETKHLSDLTESLPAGLPLEDHSSKVLAAVEEIKARISDLAELRCVKSDRHWSEQKYVQLTELAEGLGTSAEAIKTLAETHAPEQSPQEDAHDLTLKTLWQYELTRARINGVEI